MPLAVLLDSLFEESGLGYLKVYYDEKIDLWANKVDQPVGTSSSLLLRSSANAIKKS
jgi:hypothetical protein